VLTGSDRLIAGAVALVATAGLIASATMPARIAGMRAAAALPPAPGDALGPTDATPAAPPLSSGPIPAPPEPPLAGCPVAPKPPHAHPSPSAPPVPVVAEDALPAPLPLGPKAVDLTAVSGKGIWVTNWPTTDVDVAGIVARAKTAGLRSIWVRTGGSRQGYYGGTVLPALVPAAHRAGLKVVAWDFPFLSDPVEDAHRAKAALDAGIDAIAPDVETSAEGTFATARRIELYLSLVRSFAGLRPVAATVPRPTPSRLAEFPYAVFPGYADLFTPMIYWSCNEPGALVQESMITLGRLLPVAPVGQGYDMGSEGGRSGLPTFAETWRFLDVASRGGAVGASLWTIEQAGGGQWDALRSYPFGAAQ